MSFTALQFVQNSKEGNSFVGVFRYVKTSGVKSTKEGDLYGFIQISGEGNFPAERVAHMAWDGVVEGYLYSQTKSISESLKSGIEEFTRRLKDLMRNSKELEENGIEVSLVIISASKNGIYIGNLGENEIYAYRGEKVVDITEVLERNNAQTAGFPISENDLLVISTPSFISENMHTLIGKGSREEVLSDINILGKTAIVEQGLFCIYPEFKKENSKTLVKNKEDRKDDIVEKDDEYPEKKEILFKEEKKKIDFSMIASKLKMFLLSVFSFLKRIVVKMREILKRIFLKIQEFFKKRFGNKRWYKKFAARTSEVKLGKKRQPNIRIDSYKVGDLRNKRLKIVILAALAVVTLVGGYQYTRKQVQLRELNTEAEEIMNRIENRLDSAKSNLGVDRESAELDIFAINNLLSDIPEGIGINQADRLKNLEGEILGVEDDLFRRVSVSPESFTGFFEDSSDIIDMKYLTDSSLNQYLIFTDKGERAVWLVSIFDKSKIKMADNDGLIKSPEFVDIGVNKDIYVYDSSVGVLKAPFQDSGWGSFTTITGAGLNNIKVDEVKEFGVFAANDNLYYLDTKNGRIMYSVNYGTGYSSTAIVRVEDERFVNANDFIADFSIYTLTSGNEGIIRHTAGDYNPLTIIGVNGEIGKICCGNTRMNLDYGLYVYDVDNMRFLRFRKPNESVRDRRHPNELHLLNQYMYRGSDEDMWKDIRELAVDDREEFMYILDGNGVWRISL